MNLVLLALALVGAIDLVGSLLPFATAAEAPGPPLGLMSGTYETSGTSRELIFTVPPGRRFVLKDGWGFSNANFAVQRSGSPLEWIFSDFHLTGGFILEGGDSLLVQSVDPGSAVAWSGNLEP